MSFSVNALIHTLVLISFLACSATVIVGGIVAHRNDKTRRDIRRRNIARRLTKWD